MSVDIIFKAKCLKLTSTDGRNIFALVLESGNSSLRDSDNNQICRSTWVPVVAIGAEAYQTKMALWFSGFMSGSMKKSGHYASGVFGKEAATAGYFLNLFKRAEDMGTCVDIGTGDTLTSAHRLNLVQAVRSATYTSGLYANEVLMSRYDEEIDAVPALKRKMREHLEKWALSEDAPEGKLKTAINNEAETDELLKLAQELESSPLKKYRWEKGYHKALNPDYYGDEVPGLYTNADEKLIATAQRCAKVFKGKDAAWFLSDDFYEEVLWHYLNGSIELLYKILHYFGNLEVLSLSETVEGVSPQALAFFLRKTFCGIRANDLIKYVNAAPGLLKEATNLYPELFDVLLKENGDFDKGLSARKLIVDEWDKLISAAEQAKADKEEEGRRIQLFGMDFYEIESRDAMFSHCKSASINGKFRGALELENIGVYREDAGSRSNKILGVHLHNGNKYYVNSEHCEK